MSKLEDSLAEQLRLASLDEQARWPYPEPVRQYHVDWCCEHRQGEHRNLKISDVYPPKCRLCPESLAYHRPRKGRSWAIDFAYVEQRVAVECEGIVYAKRGESVGRHQTGAGFNADLEKYGWLQEHGWTVVRVSQRQITSGYALTLIASALKQAVA